MTIALLVILVLIVIFAFIAVGIYNRLVSLRNQFKNAFSQITVQLTRRYDLIPNLVETAKGYMKHERETMEAVIAARNQAVSAAKAASVNPGDATTMTALMGAEGALTSSLGRLLAISESYPDLKANQNMMQLMEELSSTENRVAFSRQAYNDAVMTYNTAREVFPNNMLAGMFGFDPAQLFEAEEGKKLDSVKVSFT